MEQIWEKKIIASIVPSVDFLNINNDILVIGLENPDGKIVFNEYFSFRFSQESYVLEIIQYHNLDGMFSMFKSRNSDFISWFESENYGIYKHGIIHYRFVFFGNVLDVISTVDPLILL